MGSLPESTSALVELAENILSSTHRLNELMASENLPEPSFDVNGPTYVVPNTASKATRDARVAVAEAAFKLFHLASGPSELLPNMTASFHTMFALQWLLHFDVLSRVPLEGSASYATLAQESGVPESQLKSVARMAMTSSILTEPETGRVAHTAASAMFLKFPNIRHWATYMFTASLPTAAAMVKATEKWPGSVEKTETAYNIAFDHNLSFFDHLSQSPDLTKQFSGYMKSVTDGQAMDLNHLVRGFGWNELPKDSLVVDVGGSTGHASLAIAAAYPNLRFEVQDLETVVSKQEAPKDPKIASRLAYKAHSFFEPQPTKGASVYLLRMIIHDWPNTEATTIIKNLVPALVENKSTLLIMDTVLPLPGRIPSTRERILRTRDLTMRQVFNALERGIDDWEALLKTADPRLQIVSVEQPEGSNMSILAVRLGSS